jgi:hypothetical protein
VDPFLHALNESIIFIFQIRNQWSLKISEDGNYMRGTTAFPTAEVQPLSLNLENVWWGVFGGGIGVPHGWARRFGASGIRKDQ